MCSINNVAGDILQIFKRALHFFQNVGVLHSYTFNHSEILFCPNAEKYLENFITILEEIKVILNKLYTGSSSRVFSEPKIDSLETCANLTAVNNHLITADLISTQHLITSNNQIIVAENQLMSESSQLIQSNTLITSHNQIITSNNEFISGMNQVIAANNEQIGSRNLNGCSNMIINSGNQMIAHGFQEEEEDGCRVSSQPVSVCNKDEEINSVATNVEPGWSEAIDVVVEKNNVKAYEHSICDKQLDSKASLNSHTTTHTGQKSFCCEHCGKLFTTSPNLAAHLTRQHNLNTESAHSCPECGKLFIRKSALNTHLAGHTGLKPFKCDICQKSFTQKVTRDTHILTHTKSYQYNCPQCPKKFANQSKLNFHLKSHGEPQYCCNLCKKKFTTKQYLTVHYKTHNIPETETPHCRLDTVSSSPTTQVFENSELKCGHCGVMFRSQRALAKHGQCKYNTLSMRYQFPLSEPLNQQKRSVTCTICGQDFPNRNMFLQHQKQNHDVVITRQKLFACHLCSKRFTMKRKLNVHIKNHSEEPSFSCEVCGRIFRRRDSLKRHMLLHSSVAKYSCITCGRLFHTQTAANNHMASHTAQYQCMLCGQTLKSKTWLKFHMENSHEGKYRFACSTCGKQFVRKCHYEEHLRTHSSDRPFKCETCGHTFKHRKHWREHLKRVHPASSDVTMQFLESITSEDALTNQQFHPMVDSSHCINDSNFVLNNQQTFNQVDQFPNTSIH